jgi:hypothetical protein
VKAIKVDGKAFSETSKKLGQGKKEVTSFGEHLMKAVKKDLGLHK